MTATTSTATRKPRLVTPSDYNLPAIEVQELRVPQLIRVIQQIDKDIADLEELFFSEQTWMIGRKYWHKLQVIRDQRMALTRILDASL